MNSTQFANLLDIVKTERQKQSYRLLKVLIKLPKSEEVNNLRICVTNLQKAVSQKDGTVEDIQQWNDRVKVDFEDLFTKYKEAAPKWLTESYILFQDA